MNERIKELRKSLGLNQTEFAERLGLKQSAIAGYENGTRTPMDSILKSICREFHVNEEWLRSGSGDMYSPPEDEDVAALSQMLDCSSDEVAQSLISFWKAYKALDDKSQQIIRDQIKAAARKISEK